MKIRILIGVLGAVLLMSRFASAQTTTVKAAWVTSEAPAVANTFTYTVREGVAVVPFTGAVTCVAQATGGGSACSAPIAPLTIGLHTLVLTASSTLGSTDSAPLTGSKPDKPTGFTITITVSVP